MPIARNQFFLGRYRRYTLLIAGKLNSIGKLSVFWSGMIKPFLDLIGDDMELYGADMGMIQIGLNLDLNCVDQE